MPYDPTMTLEDLERMTSHFVTAAQVAPILGTDPNTLRWQAHAEPGALGFPVIVMKSRVRIPRVPFIQFLRGTSPMTLPDLYAALEAAIARDDVREIEILQAQIEAREGRKPCTQ